MNVAVPSQKPPLLNTGVKSLIACTHCLLQALKEREHVLKLRFPQIVHRTFLFASDPSTLFSTKGNWPKQSSLKHSPGSWQSETKLQSHLSQSVGNNQPLSHRHRLPCCQRFKQRLLFDLNKTVKMKWIAKKLTAFKLFNADRFLFFNICVCGWSPKWKRSCCFHGIPAPYRQQLRNHRQLLGVTDVYGVIPVGLPLVADVPQVKDGRQQRKDPVQQIKHGNVQKMLERKCTG